MQDRIVLLRDCRTEVRFAGQSLGMRDSWQVCMSSSFKYHFFIVLPPLQLLFLIILFFTLQTLNPFSFSIFLLLGDFNVDGLGESFARSY